MPGYLQNVAARIVGVSLAIRPRLPSRFEPPGSSVETQAPQFPLPHQVEEVSAPTAPAALSEPRGLMPSRSLELPSATSQPMPRPEKSQPEIRPFLGSPGPSASAPIPEVPMASARKRVIVPKPEPLLEAGTANESHSPKPAAKMTTATQSVGPNLNPIEAERETRAREEVPSRRDLRIYRTKNLVSTETGVCPADVTPPAKADHREPSMFRESAFELYSLPTSPRQTEMRVEMQRTPPGEIHIVIGKLTVQALFPSQNPATPPAPVRTGPKLTLEQYLRQREGRA